jgi:hypothetical protein
VKGQRPYLVWVCAPTLPGQEKAFVVKKISHVQSRRNMARRRRKVAARHARAGHWPARPAPMLAAGKVGYQVGGNVEATCFGGIAAVHRLVTKLGLVRQLNDRLDLLKVHLPLPRVRPCAEPGLQRAVWWHAAGRH